MKKGFFILSFLGFVLMFWLAGCGQNSRNGQDDAGNNAIVSIEPGGSRDDTDNNRNSNSPAGTGDIQGDNRHGSVESKPHDVGSSKAVYPFYTVPDGETDIAALLFLGGRDEVTAGQTAAQERYFSALPNQWPDQAETVETTEWQETYLLLPKYPGTVIDVYELDQEERIVSRLISTEHAVLLRCNHSDIMPSTEVRIQYQDRTVIFRPHMSLRDGSCVAGEGIYTQALHQS